MDKNPKKTSFGWLELINLDGNPTDVDGNRKGLAFVEGTLKTFDGSSWNEIEGGEVSELDEVLITNSTISNSTLDGLTETTSGFELVGSGAILGMMIQESQITGGRIENPGLLQQGIQEIDSDEETTVDLSSWFDNGIAYIVVTGTGSVTINHLDVGNFDGKQLAVKNVDGADITLSIDQGEFIDTGGDLTMSAANDYVNYFFDLGNAAVIGGEYTPID